MPIKYCPVCGWRLDYIREQTEQRMSGEVIVSEYQCPRCYRSYKFEYVEKYPEDAVLKLDGVEPW